MERIDDRTYAGPKFLFTLKVAVDGVQLEGKAFVGYDPVLKADGSDLIYKRDEKILTSREAAKREVKDLLRFGLLPTLVYPDGREETITSLRQTADFLKQATRNIFEAFCTPEEYYGEFSMARKAA